MYGVHIIQSVRVDNQEKNLQYLITILFLFIKTLGHLLFNTFIVWQSIVHVYGFLRDYKPVLATYLGSPITFSSEGIYRETVVAN